MAKVSFAKLNLKVNTETSVLKWGEQEIEVKHFLPTDDKITIVENVIQQAHDNQNNFANPMKLDVYFVIEVLEKYTNLNITDKQKKEPQKFYDVIVSSGFWSSFCSTTAADDVDTLRNYLSESVEAFYKYRTSVLGILDSIGTDYSNLELDIDKIQKKIADPDAMAFVKDVITKLG